MFYWLLADVCVNTRSSNELPSDKYADGGSSITFCIIIFIDIKVSFEQYSNADTTPIKPSLYKHAGMVIYSNW